MGATTAFFSQNDLWGMMTEIPHWWPVTTQTRQYTLLIGWKKFPRWHKERFKAKNPLKLDLHPIFLSWELVFGFQGKIKPSKHRWKVFLAGTEYFGATAQPRDYIPEFCLSKSCVEVIQSYTFAILIWLSTTLHNLLAFNTSEISSNNSEKLSLLAWVKVHLQFCSPLRDLIPRSLFPRPKT